MPLSGYSATASSSIISGSSGHVTRRPGPIEGTSILSGSGVSLTATTGCANTVTFDTWPAWNEQYVVAAQIAIMTAASSATTNSVGTSAEQAQMMIAAVNAMNTQFTTISNSTTHTTAAISTMNTAMNTAIWTAWNNIYVANISFTNGTGSTAILNRMTPEQIQREQDRRVRVEGERSVAKERAERLLREHLSPRQREELASKGFFTLETVAPTGERRLYRIDRGRSRNVRQVDGNGRVLKTLCAHPAILVPDADTMLAQKLMLETDEQEFLRIANHS